MTLTKRSLKGLVESSDLQNVDGIYTEEDVMGVSTDKSMFPTKADLNGVNLLNYKLFFPGSFAFVADTSRRGDKIALAYNNTDKTFIVSTWYVVFKISDDAKELILPDYLYLFFNRTEFDRYARTNSWGSAREYFWFSDMEDIILEIPPLPVQEKYVNIYKAMVANQQSYERGLEDLKLVCDGFIEDLRRKMPCESIGQFIHRYDVRNGKGGTKNVMGISTSKQFREPTSKVNKEELSNYKLCHPRQIAFVQTTHNEKVFTYAFNNTNEDVVVSSVNEVFSTDEEQLLPEYLCMFFNRSEFDRYARFHSWGSARETFTWSDLVEVEIPVPKINIQQAIVDIYNVYTKRKSINEQLKTQIRNICPILIRGSLEDGK